MDKLEYDWINWIGAVLWVAAGLCGTVIQIRYSLARKSIMKSLFLPLVGLDKTLAKTAGLLFLVGLLFLIVGMALAPGR